MKLPYSLIHHWESAGRRDRLKVESTKLDLLLAARRPRFEHNESGTRSVPAKRVARVCFCLCSASAAAIVASRSAWICSALRRWNQPHFEHGTASGRCCFVISDVDALALGEQLLQLFLGD